MFDARNMPLAVFQIESCKIDCPQDVLESAFGLEPVCDLEPVLGSSLIYTIYAYTCIHIYRYDTYDCVCLQSQVSSSFGRIIRLRPSALNQTHICLL